MNSFLKKKMSISFPATQGQKLIKENNRYKLFICEKPRATEVPANALGEECRVIWSKSVVGVIWLPYEARCPGPQQCSCCWARSMLVLDQGETEKGSTGPFTNPVWMPILNLVILGVGWDRYWFLYWQESLCLRWGPEELAELITFSLCKENDAYQYAQDG